MKKFDHLTIEKKWQKVWKENKTYQPDLEKAKKPFYNLMMFPYPSAEGLHVGNMYAFTGADVYGRFQRMQGHDVFEPIGLDGFGIHSENYALKVGKHPREQAKVSEENFYRQLHEIGNGFAWDNKLETYDPEYYKWTQWLFVQMFKNGLAYRGKAMVNWCPKDKTVLADEQVEAGVCERCKTPVERRPMEQWFFKITEYADRLLENIEKINWPEKIKIAQRQWIGKKEGALVKFQITNHKSQINSKFQIKTFTTRLDTIFGVTFIVVAPEIAKDLLNEIPEDKKEQVKKYIEESLKKTEQQRKVEEKEKTGIDTGLFAINPVNNKEVPVYAADYVLMDVGTGAVMGVPAHDERDFAFAKKHNIEIKTVVMSFMASKDKRAINRSTTDAFAEDGILVNSGEFNELKSVEARKKIAEKFPKTITKTYHYHLRDWLISRQRYWGPPIPMINCEKCARLPDGQGWQAVPENQLPVLLPDLKDWQPKGDGRGPLENAPEEWLYTKCPNCGGKAKRETDVSDTFLDSSWYFLKYPSINIDRHAELGSASNLIDSGSESGMKKDVPWDKEITKKWLPVNAYIGGAEHAVLHLLYARFVTMTLKDWGLVDFEEPFPFLFSHGLIVKDGAKMSKSRGNVVIPDKYIKEFGADTLRMYLMFLGPYDQGGDFRDTGIMGMRKFVERVWNLLTDSKKVTDQTTKNVEIKLHQTIKDMGRDIGSFQYNTAIARYMELVNVLKQEKETISQADAVSMVKLISPFAPHATEELYQQTAHSKPQTEGKEFKSIHQERWPEYDESFLVKDEVTIVIQVNGKLRASVIVDPQTANSKQQIVEKAKQDEKIKQYLERKIIKKEIFVPGKLVNFVI